MQPAPIATNAASSGIKLERKTLKQLGRRSDVPGLIWMTHWIVFLLGTGTLLHLSLGSWWVVPAMIAYGAVLVVPAYALSHETSHGTAFRTRWLNDVLLWVSSFIYFEEPYHRRYAHTSHHTYTMHVGKDGQMPFALPMTFKEWVLELTHLGFYWYEIKLFIKNALGRFSPLVLQYTPEGELPKLKWGARAYLAAYAALLAFIAAGHMWPLLYIIIPRLVGGPVMQMFTILQHAELSEDAPSILDSTRSYKGGWLSWFLYMNMNNHLEHHLYPQVPFYALPGLQKAIEDQVPEPDPGFWRTNYEVAIVVLRRSLGLNTKAPSIRQAPHMITEGGFSKIAEANMR